MIYLDNVVILFLKLLEVYEEVLKCMKNYVVNLGRGFYEIVVKVVLKIMEIREEICNLFNILSFFNLIFISNVIEVLNIGIKGILEKGDYVISIVIEYNFVLRLLYLLSEKGVDVILISLDKVGYVSIKDIKDEIKKNIKMIIISYIFNVLGSI